jgi:hypothetical protein
MSRLLSDRLDRLHNPVITDLSTKDLILTRDETIRVQEDLDSFYTVRFIRVTDPTDSNPGGMPTLKVPMQTELASNAMRLVGQGIEEQLDDLDIRIDHLTEELIRRIDRKPE